MFKYSLEMAHILLCHHIFYFSFVFYHKAFYHHNNLPQKLFITIRTVGQFVKSKAIFQAKSNLESIFLISYFVLYSLNDVEDDPKYKRRRTPLETLVARSRCLCLASYSLGFNERLCNE